MPRLISLFAAILLYLNILSAQQTENIFIVVIDGSRYTETFGDTSHQYIPKIWNELRPQGTIYTSFYIDGQTSTNPGHATILTGTWQYIANDGSQRPTQPTLFEYARKQHNTPASDQYVILGKSKLNILSYSTKTEYGSNYGASVMTSTSEYDDNVTYNNVISVIDTHHPQLVIINFAETDAAGHAGVWTTYVNAIKKVDNLISNLGTYIQNDTVYSDKTTMLVTNDHGRHSNSFTSHGDNCQGCRHIMLLAIGPDTPAGAVDSTIRKQTDIAPTVGHLLKFDTPYCTGNIITSASITDVSANDVAAWQNTENFELYQNYPNPFNPITDIEFRITNSDFVTLDIYNRLGQKVRRLIHRELQAGRHQVRFNGSDLASGVYYYRLQTLTGFAQIKQLVLVK